MAKYYDGYDWDTDGFPGDFVYGDGVYIEDYYMDERWKPIYDIPGYWISTKARIWSNISESFVWGTPLRSGHIDVSLRCYGRRVHRYLHRLVAEAFIPNPEGYPEVRHLDDDPSNNEVWNLAWGTQYDNVQDCINNGNFRYFTRGEIERANEIRRIPIVAVCLRNGKMSHFKSQQEASRILGIEQSCISAVINGYSRSAGGYYFSKEGQTDNWPDLTNYNYQHRGRPVRAINIHNGETYVYDSPRKAAYDLGVCESSISNILRGKVRSSKGWTFEYADMESDYYD